MQLVNIIKPTHRCNLACKYCYNEDIRHPVMSLDILEKTIKYTFDYASSNKVFTYVHFIWHGGEPMLPGINFYENVIDFQEKYSNGIKYLNALQTNGTLITQRWCDFIKKNKLFMSISIDGPKDLNDKNRITHKNTGSFNKIIEGINKLRRNNIDVGCALVMSRTNIDHTDEIYDFMLENKLPFNVIPLNKSGNAIDNYQDLGLGPDEYYVAWSKLYDKWFYAEPENYIFVSDFVRKTQAILAGRAADCIGMAQCGNTSFSVDPVGDLYPCASLSAQPDMKYGNLQNNSILELMSGMRATIYRTRESTDSCKKCKWQHVCHGGCPARAYKYHDNDIYHKDYYCPSLYKMYEHIEKRLNERGLTASKPYSKHMSDGLLGTSAFLEIEKNKFKLIEVVNIK